jgi:arabinofuranosyltransferase
VSRWTFALCLLLAAAVAVAGWHLFWFQCDDAYITFRYVHNLHVGRGPVWNPDPFLPVEGYTSPLWVLVLAAAWSLTGVEPPVAANWIALASGLLLLVCVARFVLRAPWLLALRRGRAAVLLLCLLTIAGNRTFATWLSSGMETSLFALCFCGWALLAVRCDEPAPPRRWLALASTATLAALTRPEGWLCAVATGALLLRRARRGGRRGAVLAAGAPLLLVVVHELWRRWYYGEWLPNTWYAKANDWWPEAGVRYLLSFVVEEGCWVVLPAALAAAPRALRALRARPRPWHNFAVAGAVLALLAFYVLRIGGDHFDYRPFVPMLPLLAVWLPSLCARAGPAAVIAAQAAMLLASTFGWWQWARTRDIPPQQFRALAPDAWAPLRPVVRAYDRWQAWLRLHAICLRGSAFQAFTEQMQSSFKGRIFCPEAWPGIPIMDSAAVGVFGWNLPDVAILDDHGLNDWVVARTPPRTADAPGLSAALLDDAFAQSDRDRDGALDRGELLAALPRFQPGLQGQPEEAAKVLDTVLALQDRDGDGRLDRRELDGIGAAFGPHRMIAHEHWRPEEYARALPTNVVVTKEGRLVITPHDPPLDAARVRAIEQEWRARLR